ncbi:DUF1217 domain-containing protein [Aquicoccus sp. G2-2]|uniref:DUF1217 domain-containing protein n=1 Tax=Aquicoccus sp. G2-2 TaxID=3092120 RepID=UPI002AE052B1|nr:DUF1217 domain-containing protein [Aquicoccus sp. G2-2]MEA1114409.1 DUF1217 domain-containing protein [Aquicoccus sp. G2-2]
MSFQPVIAGSGLSGWSFLNRTIVKQEAAFEASADMQRDTDYFRAKIGTIDTAEQLVSDRRLRKVALGAFGLQDDIDNIFFIRKVLDGGTIAADSLANRMSDSRYKAFSKAFGFGDFAIPRSKLSTFADEITSKYNARSFEVAVGQQDENLRLALSAKRELAGIAADDGSDDTKWFRVMGSSPLRKVFETALGLPSSFGQLELDQQLATFRDKAGRQLGNGEIGQFGDEAAVEKLVQRFLVRAQLADVQSSTAGSIALTLLQGTASG